MNYITVLYCRGGDIMPTFNSTQERVDYLLAQREHLLLTASSMLLLPRDEFEQIINRLAAVDNELRFYGI